MANLGFFEINTDGEYENLATLTELTFTAEAKYNFQVQNRNGYFIACLSETKPTDGGFIMNNNEKFSWTVVSGEDCWVKTTGNGVYLNVSN